MAKDDLDLNQRGILGDINPVPSARDRGTPAPASDGEENQESMTGGTGTEVGGTRNYRQGTGATGTDIGNRPE